MPIIIQENIHIHLFVEFLYSTKLLLLVAAKKRLIRIINHIQYSCNLMAYNSINYGKYI